LDKNPNNAFDWKVENLDAGLADLGIIIGAK